MVNGWLKATFLKGVIIKFGSLRSEAGSRPNGRP